MYLVSLHAAPRGPIHATCGPTCTYGWAAALEKQKLGKSWELGFFVLYQAFFVRFLKHFNVKGIQKPEFWGF